MNQILKRQTSRFHYDSKVPAVTITVFITLLEQNRYNSCQSSTKFSEVNVKNTFTSHIDKKLILTFLLTSLSLYIFTIWKSIVYYRFCRDGIYFDKRHYDLHLHQVRIKIVIYLKHKFKGKWQNLIQPTISLEMPVPSQGHYGFHSFPVVDWFCLFIYLWVLTFPL